MTWRKNQGQISDVDQIRFPRRPESFPVYLPSYILFVFLFSPLCVLPQTISFDASEMEEGTVVSVDVDLVKERVSDMLEGSDLTKYII